MCKNFMEYSSHTSYWSKLIEDEFWKTNERESMLNNQVVKIKSLNHSSKTKTESVVSEQEFNIINHDTIVTFWPNKVELGCKRKI